MLTPPMAQRIEIWPLEKLIRYARKSRTHSDAQVAQIAASIAAFGFNNPLLVDTMAGTLLAAELAALQQGDFDVRLIGFDDEELARLLAAHDVTKGLCDEEGAPPTPQMRTAELGDLWLRGLREPYRP